MPISPTLLSKMLSAPKVADPIQMLQDLLQPNIKAVRNGPYLSGWKTPDGTIALSPHLATELLKLVKTYRDFYTVSHRVPPESLGLEKWAELLAHVKDKCDKLDDITEPGRKE